ncbi:MAG: T9SS type A sorting domain-containing protein [Bacteroidota bacterium]
MKIKMLLLTFVGSLLGAVSLAQSSKLPTPTQQNIAIDVQVTYAEYLGKVPPIRELIPVPSTTRERRKLSKRPRRVPPNFAGRRLHPILAPEKQYIGPDPLRQFGNGPTKSGDTLVIEPLVNTDGLIDGASPSDPTGDVGLEYYLQAINVTEMGVFTKTGELVQAFAANTIWNPLGFSSAGDPIVLFDQEAERWIMTEFPPGNQLLVAISETSDPLGAWSAYNFATPSFPDYPKYGIWGNAYSVTTNEGGAGLLHAYFIDRAAMLAGEEEVSIQRLAVMGNDNTVGGFFVATPVNWIGDAPSSDTPTLLALNDSSWGMADQDQVELYEVKLNWDDPALTEVTNTSIPSTPFDAHACASPGFGFACIPQMNGNGLDGIPEVIMNQSIYRNFTTHESIVLNFMTDVDGNELSGIRWMELRRIPGQSWGIYQEGTYAPDDGLHRFMGSIAVDRRGNIGLAYNVSSENTFAGVRFTGRRATDTLGRMTVEEYVAVEGQSTLNSGGRFGDYGHMAVDPVNGRTFWHTTEYAGPGGQARTRIIAFEFSRDSIDLAASSLLTPVTSSELTETETVSFLVLNDGLKTIDTFTLGLEFEGNLLELDTVELTLQSDSTYLHTFDATVDLSVLGDYDFRLFVNTLGDEFARNDTLVATVTHLPRRDVAITNISTDDYLNCGTVIRADLVLTNFGTNELETANVEWSFNGEAQDPIAWTGSLVSGESTLIPVTKTGVVDETNTIFATANTPNSQADERPENNGTSRDVVTILDGVELNLNIQMDQYPEDISWEVLNEDGAVLFSGGNYGGQDGELIIEPLCLDPDRCYVFEIVDAYGDGLCCQQGDGNYTITDAEGLPLLTSDGDFDTGETRDFCAVFVCMLDFAVEASPTSTAGETDGMIIMIDEAGLGPFEYSIDNGNTFQADNTFTGLAAGDYEVVVLGLGGCSYEETVTIAACTLDASFSIVNESTNNANDGSIEVDASSAAGDLTYQIDGGNPQDSPIFDGLAGGEYEITVNDGLGCSITQTVTVDITVGVNDPVVQGEYVRIYPNPTKGVFQLEVVGLEARELFLPLEVYDVRGRRLYRSQLPQYNGQYTGALSLYAYPTGTYFLRILDDRLPGLIRVVKE